MAEKHPFPVRVATVFFRCRSTFGDIGHDSSELATSKPLFALERCLLSLEMSISDSDVSVSPDHDMRINGALSCYSLE